MRWMLFFASFMAIAHCQEIKEPAKVDSCTLSEGKLFERIRLTGKGGEVKMLTSGEYQDRCPAFSADMQRICFLRRAVGSGDNPPDVDWIFELWTMGLDGEHQKKISGDYRSGAPTWDPKGERVVFVGGPENDHHDLICFDFKTGEFKTLVKQAGSWPTWSPDGKSICYYDTENRICVLDLSSGNVL